MKKNNSKILIKIKKNNKVNQRYKGNQKYKVNQRYKVIQKYKVNSFRTNKNHILVKIYINN